MLTAATSGVQHGRPPVGAGRAGLALRLAVSLLGGVAVAGCQGGGQDSPAPSASATTSSSAASGRSAAERPVSVPLSGAGRVPLRRFERGRTEASSPDWLAVAGGALWMKLDGGEVARVDIETGDVVATVPPPPQSGFCQAFGASRGFVYSCPREGLLQRIDPRTNRVAATIPLAVLGDQGHLVAAGGRVWAITGDAQEIRGVDPADDSVGSPVPLGVYCTELAASGHTVWASCPTDGRLLRVDTRAGKVTGQLELAGIRQVAAGQSVWAGVETGVVQIDPDTLTVEARYEIPLGVGGSIYVDDVNVLLRAEGGPFLAVLDPRAHTIVRTVEAPGLPSGGNVVRASDSLWASAFDDGVLLRLDASLAAAGGG